MKQAKNLKPPILLDAIFGDRTPSLMDSLFPRLNVGVKLFAALGFAAFTAVMANWGRFYLIENPVPVSLQSLGVLSSGIFLGARWGILSMLFYYVVGIVGAPVFAGGNSGWEYAMGVTGGYLIGFVLASITAGWLSQHGLNRGLSLWAVLIGSIVLYIPALIWLRAFDFGWPDEGRLLSDAVYPFIIGDLLKVLAVSAGAVALWRVSDARSTAHI